MLTEFPRTGMQVQYPIFKPMPFRPVGGMVRFEPGDSIPPEASPDMMNCAVYEGNLRRRPGYVQFPAGAPSIGGPVLGLYSTQDNTGATHLIATWAEGVVKWAGGEWTPLTGPALTGSEQEPFVFAQSQEAIVFSQGRDPVMIHDLVPSNLTYGALNASFCPPARFLERWASRLFIGHTIEGGKTLPFRIRRPIANDHTNWTGTGSGFTEVDSEPHQLRGLKKLGSQLVLYTENGIWVATQQVISAAPYTIDQKVPGVGVLCERTLVEIPGLGHGFVGNGDVFLYPGGSAVQGLAMPIRDRIFQTISPSFLRQSFGTVIEDLKEAVFFIPTAGELTADTPWAFNYNRNIWYPWKVSGVLCSALHRLDDTVTIDQLQGTIDEQVWIFDARALQAAFPAHITGHTDGKIYKWGPYSSDNGAAIPCRWTSKDFTSSDVDPSKPVSNITLRQLDITYEDTGTSPVLRFYFSEDGGSTWDGPFPVTLQSKGGVGIQDTTLSHQTTASSIRFKFEHESIQTTFSIRNFTPVFEMREQLF
jgi:hypothetical protein